MKYSISIVAFGMLTVGSTSVAVSADVCGETVPANRFIDGFPAYAQCADAMNSAIYSSNGIDTATISGGSGWIRTQYSGGYQCTELAHRYLYFKFNVPSVPDGNAGVWCDGTLPAQLVKASSPVHGDLIVLAPGSCGADSVTGHVAVVDTIGADGASVMAVQQNMAGRSKYALTCAACFLHATANVGGSGDGGAVDGGVSDVGAGTDAAMVDGPVFTDAAVGVDAAGGRSGGSGGVSATGGSSATGGTGGALGTGGTSNTGGTNGLNGSGGSRGSGGVTGPGGSGGANGTGGVPAPGAGVTAGDSGCACEVGSKQGGPGEMALGFLAGVGCCLMRRRRRH